MASSAKLTLDAGDCHTKTSPTLCAAFQQLHGPLLFRFALLLNLGDWKRAERATKNALADGAARVDELRHPERAAAWLRRHIVRSAPCPRTASADGRDILAALAIPEPTVAALSRLGRLERAALLGSEVEGFDSRDVEAIVNCRGTRFERLLTRARRRYAAAEATVPGPRHHGNSHKRSISALQGLFAIHPW
jgi:DNA-directed RNA polymerase specialized sigma24 family protein